ncbi:hypothetical protein U6G28_02150 [Actinomycetaceae bacterium MB13-C1-2]|nr:hypothetical protein U6G28_02150 [Actinomycetaceae bacterium MB13-C1-2]
MGRRITGLLVAVLGSLFFLGGPVYGADPEESESVSIRVEISSLETDGEVETAVPDELPETGVGAGAWIFWTPVALVSAGTLALLYAGEMKRRKSTRHL